MSWRRPPFHKSTTDLNGDELQQFIFLSEWWPPRTAIPLDGPLFRPWTGASGAKATVFD